MNVHVKTGDTVVILSGKDKGKKGKVLAVSPKEGKVIVEQIYRKVCDTTGHRKLKTKCSSTDR